MKIVEIIALVNVFVVTIFLFCFDWLSENEKIYKQIAFNILFFSAIILMFYIYYVRR